MLRSWRITLLLLAFGVAVLVYRIAEDRPLRGTVQLAGIAVIALALSPLAFAGSLPAAEAQSRSEADGRPVVYWRPGCQYCLRLRVRLWRHGRRAYWVNIWDDPAGAAVVRAAAGGNETVPTVVLDGQAFVNPDPAWLRDELRTR